MMKKIKKYGYHLMSFLIPMMIVLGILCFKGVFNDIEEFMVSDLRIQHLSFLNYFKNVMLGNESLYYSFNAGMGSSMLATIVFYCISPVNLLLFLIKDIQYAILWIYIVKIALSGMMMYILLKSNYDNDKNNNLMMVLFSSCYSLCSFSVCYFFSGFWLDSLYLAPLVILGIDKIFKNGKINLLYIISLSMAIIYNIQMGFGLCIYSVIYFIYSYLIRYEFKKDFKKFKRYFLIFLISSLCVGAISSGIILTNISEYGNILLARDGINNSGGVSNIGYILKNLFSVGNLKTNYYNNYEPLIYCGLIVTYNSFLYLFNKDIDKRKRLCSLGVILFFIVSFCVSFINVFWHLSTPVMLNFRYSGYLSLFLVMISYECYISKNRLNGSDITILSLFMIGGLIIILIYSSYIYITYTFIFLVLTFIFILLSKNKSKKFEVLLGIVIVLEIFMNGYLSMYMGSDLSYVKYGSYDNLLELGMKKEFSNDYRVMYNYSYTDYANDGLLLSKNSSLRYFSSVIDGDTIKFFERNSIGRGVNNYIVSAYDSPLLISLMGNKYFYLTEELHNSVYNKVSEYKIDDVYDYGSGKSEDRMVYLYENPYALSLGYVINNDVEYYDDMNLVDYQNGLIKGFTGNGMDVMIELPRGVDNNSKKCESRNFFDCKTYIVNNTTDNLNVYVYANYDEFDVDNRNARVYMDNGEPFMVSTFDKQIAVTLGYSSKIEDDDLVVATYNEDNLINSLSYLQEDMLEDIEIDGNILTGKIDSSRDGILYLSIPYDDKFKIYVDKREVDYYSLLDNSFIGIDIDKGEHDILVEYKDDNFIWYVGSSVLSIFVTIFVYFYVNKWIDKKNDEERKMIELLEEKKNKNREKRKQRNKKK